MSVISFQILHEENKYGKMLHLVNLYKEYMGICQTSRSIFMF